MTDQFIRVSIAEQRLQLLEDGAVVMDVAVSTARNGPGERSGSECTPRGLHYVRAKIGANCPENTVFVGRRPTGEIYKPELRTQFPGRDWILTRIMWLCGLEPGKNRLGNVDTMRRYVYIHGCPEDDIMGEPTSHGCVKMRNQDVMDLFERIGVGVQVQIMESPMPGQI